MAQQEGGEIVALEASNNEKKLSAAQLTMMRLLSVMAFYQRHLPEAMAASNFDPMRLVPAVRSACFINETNRVKSILFGIQNRTLVPIWQPHIGYSFHLCLTDSSSVHTFLLFSGARVPAQSPARFPLGIALGPTSE
jgi:hypothetical protein